MEVVAQSMRECSCTRGLVRVFWQIGQAYQTGVHSIVAGTATLLQGESCVSAVLLILFCLYVLATAVVLCYIHTDTQQRFSS